MQHRGLYTININSESSFLNGWVTVGPLRHQNVKMKYYFYSDDYHSRHTRMTSGG